MTISGKPPAMLDTNVASYVLGDKPERALYSDDCKGRVLLLSFQTVAEMLAGAEIAGWGRKRRAELHAFVDGHETIHTDDETVAVWARLRGIGPGPSTRPSLREGLAQDERNDP